MSEEKTIPDGTGNPLRLTTAKRVRLTLHPLAVQADRAKGKGEGQCIFECKIPMMIWGNEDALAKRALLCVFTLLPSEMRREIEACLSSLGKAMTEIEEIRLSRDALSSLLLSGREYALRIRVGSELMGVIVKGICHGAPFAHREEMAEGFLPFDEGVRVGVCGVCRYGGVEGSTVSEVHTLVFRIPHTPPETSCVRELYKSLRKHSRLGCLIVSPPRVGKTTVLRMLCRAFAEGEGGVRVAVVDTRREFSPRDAEGTFMDILSGYPRQSGALIALRTLSPSVLGMDEIGCDADTEALLEVMRAGVRILATAHARGAQDIYRRRHLKRSVEAGVFDTVLSLSREGSTLGARLCHL